MDVFRISEDPRHPFRDTPAGWNNVTLSNAAFERFRKKMPEFSQTTPLGNGDSVTIIKQMGKTGAFRSYRYGVEEPWFFYHLGENMIKAEFADNWSQIVFRVKPAADGPDYREKFLREIAPKLDTDNAFVADAAPYTEQQLQFEVMNGDTDKVNSQAVVVLFLLGTLFLKVVAMAVTNAAGGVGGSFAPSLFTGAFVGGTLAYICNTFFGMEMSVVNFSLVGMAGVMTGVMKAPLTSVFLIAELSNGYGLFVPLMLVASLSFAISYYLEPDSIYTKKLRAKGELVTHNKDRAVMVFLDLDKLIETNFSPVSKEATLGDLVHIISSSKRNVFPVIKEGGEFAGIILLDDIRTDMFDQAKYRTPVSKYVVQPPDIIFKNEMISEVVEKFEESRAWNLPVVDKNNRYLGFVSKSSILEAYRQQLIEITEE